METFTVYIHFWALSFLQCITCAEPCSTRHVSFSTVHFLLLSPFYSVSPLLDTFYTVYALLGLTVYTIPTSGLFLQCITGTEPCCTSTYPLYWVLSIVRVSSPLDPFHRIPCVGPLQQLFLQCTAYLK